MIFKYNFNFKRRLEHLSFYLLFSSTELRWICFKNSNIGDAGLRELTRYVSKIKVQALIFECCGLTDKSCEYIASIMKVKKKIKHTVCYDS